MEQEKLFHDDIYDAIRTAVQRIGGTKKVGATLWPEKSVTQAGELLANCLNRSRPEKLDPEQVLLIKRLARQANCHVIVAFENEDCGYKPPVPIEPVDEMAELQRTFIESVKQQKELADRMQRAQMRLGRDLGVVEGG